MKFPPYVFKKILRHISSKRSKRGCLGVIYRQTKRRVYYNVKTCYLHYPELFHQKMLEWGLKTPKDPKFDQFQYQKVTNAILDLALYQGSSIIGHREILYRDLFSLKKDELLFSNLHNCMLPFEYEAMIRKFDQIEQMNEERYWKRRKIDYGY